MKGSSYWQVFVVSGMLGAVLMGSGCSTTTGQQAQVSPQVTHIETVRFSRDLYVPGDMRVTDETDPQQMIMFALSLSERGRHEQAAEFFTEAAKKFCSERNELAVSCRAAAANEYLLAGDVGSFRTAVKELKQEMDRFQTAAVDEKTAAVLALGDIAAKVGRPSSTTPKGLRELYRD